MIALTNIIYAFALFVSDPHQMNDKALQKCKDAKARIETMLNAPSDRLRAWRTWAPNCRGNGYYEWILGHYHEQNGDTHEADKIYQLGIETTEGFDQELKAALDHLHQSSR